MVTRPATSAGSLARMAQQAVVSLSQPWFQRSISSRASSTDAMLRRCQCRIPGSA
jgi:hypothetical protein